MSNYISWLQQEMEIRQLNPNGMTQQAMEEKASWSGGRGGASWSVAI